MTLWFALSLRLSSALPSFARQDGTDLYDLLYAVSATEDGSFVLAGKTTGVLSGLASAGGVDFAAVKLDADGNEIWRWQVRSEGAAR